MLSFLVDGKQNKSRSQRCTLRSNRGRTHLRMLLRRLDGQDGLHALHALPRDGVLRRGAADALRHGAAAALLRVVLLVHAGEAAVLRRRARPLAVELTRCLVLRVLLLLHDRLKKQRREAQLVRTDCRFLAPVTWRLFLSSPSSTGNPGTILSLTPHTKVKAIPSPFATLPQQQRASHPLTSCPGAADCCIEWNCCCDVCCCCW